MSAGGFSWEPDRVRAPAPPHPVEPLARLPTFSVVVPAYEAAATIGETLDSILSQSPPPLETIVVDDGSKDDLASALAAFEGRIELLRGPNQGVAAARNRGLRRARGEFVLVIDADDVMLPGRIEALGRMAQARPDLDLLCTDLYFEVEGRRVGTFYGENSFPTEGQRAAIMRRCFPISPASRRSRLDAVGGFDESLPTAEDWDCALRMILAGSGAGLYEQPLGAYRIHPGSLTDSRASSLRDRATMLEKARTNPDLQAQESGGLESALTDHRYRANLASAQQALVKDRQDVRRKGLRLALGKGTPPRDRLWGLALSLAPASGRRALRRRAGAERQLSRVMRRQSD